MGLLNIGDILSYIDSRKRVIGDWAKNPDQLWAQMNEDARDFRRRNQRTGLLSDTDFANSPEFEIATGLLGTVKPGLFRVFHGSHNKVSGNLSTTAKKTTGGSFNKYGVSVSENPAVASRYASDFHQSPTVYPMELGISKPLNLTAQEFEQLQKLVGKMDAGKPLTEIEDVGLEMMLSKHGVKHGGHPIERIREAGYDVINKDAGRYGVAEAETLVFDPSKLRFLFDKP